jgi:hypothetical protein
VAWNKVLRIMFGSKREGARKGGWRKIDAEDTDSL